MRCYVRLLNIVAVSVQACGPSLPVLSYMVCASSENHPCDFLPSIRSSSRNIMTVTLRAKDVRELEHVHRTLKQILILLDRAVIRHEAVSQPFGKARLRIIEAALPDKVHLITIHTRFDLLRRTRYQAPWVSQKKRLWIEPLTLESKVVDDGLHHLLTFGP